MVMLLTDKFYFLKGLDVDKDVTDHKILPNQYLVLRFDFSMIERSDDIRQTELSLGYMINNSIMEFYKSCAPYLGEGARLIEKRVHKNPAESLRECVKLVRDTLRKVIENEEQQHPLARVKGVSAHRLHFV